METGKVVGVDPRVCTNNTCQHYLNPVGCESCVKGLVSYSCDVCYSHGPAYPVFHLGPAPFVVARIGDCIECGTSGIELNVHDKCEGCLLIAAKLRDQYTKRGIISVLCDAHSHMVTPYCVNGHKLYGHSYAGNTLLCYSCFNTGPSVCLGCGIFHTSKNRDLCRECQIKVNNNICTSCGGDTYQEYVERDGSCQKCNSR